MQYVFYEVKESHDEQKEFTQSAIMKQKSGCSKNFKDSYTFGNTNGVPEAAVNRFSSQLFSWLPRHQWGK